MNAFQHWSSWAARARSARRRARSHCRPVGMYPLRGNRSQTSAALHGQLTPPALAAPPPPVAPPIPTTVAPPVARGGRRLPAVGQDLPAGAVSGHAGLVGALVAAVLQADHLLALPQHVLAEVPLVLISHLHTQRRAVEAFLLRLKRKIVLRWRKLCVRFIIIIFMIEKITTNLIICYLKI